MGMNHFGEIHRLSTATQPTVGIITNIGVSHIENLGSREGILEAKLEILDGLKKGAPLLLNGDNDLLSTVKNDDYKIYFYAVDNDADFKAVDIKENPNTTSFTVQYFGKEQSIEIPAIGKHNVYNALAAFAVGILLDIDAETAADALKNYEPSGMRQKVVEINGITSIEDCYNASPDSMKAGVTTLAGIKACKKLQCCPICLNSANIQNRHIMMQAEWRLKIKLIIFSVSAVMQNILLTVQGITDF